MERATNQGTGLVIVLTGGISRRMGRAKALLPLSGQDSSTFIEAILAKTQPYGEQIVVSSLAADLLPAGLQVVEQAHPDRGQLDSTQLAWRSKKRPASWALICPVDHPYFYPETLQSLFSARRQNPKHLLWTPSYQQQGGHPVLFSAAFMDELDKAPPELGARPVLRRYHDQRYFLNTEDERIIWDVDTPEDYEKYVKKYQSFD